MVTKSAQRPRRNTLEIGRRWALFATDEGEAAEIAEAVRLLGNDWRLVLIAPGRLLPAIESILPSIVIVDPKLPGGLQLRRSVQRLCGGDVLVFSAETFLTTATAIGVRVKARERLHPA